MSFNSKVYHSRPTTKQWTFIYFLKKKFFGFMIMMQTHYYVSLPSPSWTDRQTAQLKQTNMSSDLIRSMLCFKQHDELDTDVRTTSHDKLQLHPLTDRPTAVGVACSRGVTAASSPSRTTDIVLCSSVACCRMPVIYSRICFQCHSRFRERREKNTSYEKTSIVPVDGPTDRHGRRLLPWRHCSVVSFPHDRHHAL